MAANNYFKVIRLRIRAKAVWGADGRRDVAYESLRTSRDDIFPFDDSDRAARLRAEDKAVIRKIMSNDDKARVVLYRQSASVHWKGPTVCRADEGLEDSGEEQTKHHVNGTN